MYAATANTESLRPTRQTKAFETTGRKTRLRTTTPGAAPTRPDAEINAWARHAQSANGFGDGG
ncbi:MAG TPA: hypothetical protein VLS27_01275, partial [Gammaproteobacteria bacterium]|nr:hypothetical protein [Gammaproteobacteria bacterium]